MPEFLRLLSPADALERFLAAFPAQRKMPPESMLTSEALDRVLAENICAPHALPQFRRSTMDGYAVRAADTHGASPSLPAYLSLAGEVRMGAAATITLGPGQAALVHTGGMIPGGADAVVMVEDTQRINAAEIEVFKPVAAGQHVIAEGEDVTAGEVILQAGTRLRPQEIGGLLALGLTEVQVSRRPRVGILSTGDEVLPPDATPGPGQVRDINSCTLAALVQRAGGQPIRHGIIPDNFEALLQAATAAHAEDDLVVITAGSSVSVRDITADVMASLGHPGVLVHGVSIKPGKPTILAVADGVPLIGLPGNPVSALVVATLFVSPAIRRLLGEHAGAVIPSVPARLATNVPSEAGRVDYLPVHLVETTQGWVAEPVYGRSNLIFTLVRADGLVCIPADTTGLEAGVQVSVVLF
jgi:molybdopterin molybdotransferase